MDRNEAKDFADIFAIANHLKEINWKEMFVSASSKSAGIFAPLFAERLASFDTERFEELKWIGKYNWKILDHSMNEILHSIIALE